MSSFTLVILFFLNGQVVNGVGVYEPTFAACEVAKETLGGQINVPGMVRTADCKPWEDR